MFPCCWIIALIALLASLGISVANLKLGLIVGGLASTLAPEYKYVLYS